MAITKVPLVGMIAEVLAARLNEVQHALHRHPNFFALLQRGFVFAQVWKCVKVFHEAHGRFPSCLLTLTSLQWTSQSH